MNVVSEVEDEPWPHARKQRLKTPPQPISGASRRSIVSATFSPNQIRAMTWPADDAIKSDEIECMLFALHRAGHLDLRELIYLQVEYLREAKP
jgi:hypothetical protein